jgi:hypothetical protein
VEGGREGPTCPSKSRPGNVESSACKEPLSTAAASRRGVTCQHAAPRRVHGCAGGGGRATQSGSSRRGHHQPTPTHTRATAVQGHGIHAAHMCMNGGGGHPLRLQPPHAPPRRSPAGGLPPAQPAPGPCSRAPAGTPRSVACGLTWGTPCSSCCPTACGTKPCSRRWEDSHGQGRGRGWVGGCHCRITPHINSGRHDGKPAAPASKAMHGIDSVLVIPLQYGGHEARRRGLRVSGVHTVVGDAFKLKCGTQARVHQMFVHYPGRARPQPPPKHCAYSSQLHGYCAAHAHRRGQHGGGARGCPLPADREGCLCAKSQHSFTEDRHVKMTTGETSSWKRSGGRNLGRGSGIVSTCHMP